MAVFEPALLRGTLAEAGVQDDLGQWQVQGSAAELYERYLVPAVTLQWAVDLVARVDLRAGDRVLDVACGTGVVARAAAEHGARVAGLDLNAAMLAVARSRPSVGPVPIEWYEGSALSLPFDDDQFGVVLCQFGLQFVPDPLLALTEMRRVLALYGRVGVSVFAELERNPVAHALSDALDRHLGEGASAAKRSEHALGDVEAVVSLFREAGFATAQIETVAKTSRYPSVSDYVRFQLQATPLATLLERYEEPERDRLATLLVDDLRTELAAFDRDGEFAFPQLAHVATNTAR
jgi:ubiquinone/menaquinone biosynthesis C-methylase UbiE